MPSTKTARQLPHPIKKRQLQGILARGESEQNIRDLIGLNALRAATVHRAFRLDLEQGKQIGDTDTQGVGNFGNVS